MAKGKNTKILEVNETWRLKSDNCNWTLQKLIKTEKHKNGIWTDMGHHPSLLFALDELCKQEFKISGTLQDVMNKIKELKALLASLNFDKKVEK